MNKKIPEFSYTLLYNIYFLLLTLGFSLLFISFYSPFSMTNWFVEGNRLANFAIASIVIFAAFGFLFFSRLILYLICKKIKLSYWQYLIWILLEFMMFALFYSIFTKFVLLDIRDFTAIFSRTSFYTFLILLIPYALSFLYFHYLEKSKELAQLKVQRKKKKLESKIEKKSDLINFIDEKGVLRLSIRCTELYYIESNVNNVTIYYSQNEELQQFTMRSSLVKIEESAGCPNLIRCHRSFLINFDKVKSFKKEKDGGVIELDHTSNPIIPVSKTYIEILLKKFKEI